MYTLLILQLYYCLLFCVCFVSSTAVLQLIIVPSLYMNWHQYQDSKPWQKQANGHRVSCPCSSANIGSNGLHHPDANMWDVDTFFSLGCIPGCKWIKRKELILFISLSHSIRYQYMWCRCIYKQTYYITDITNKLCLKTDMHVYMHIKQYIHAWCIYAYKAIYTYMIYTGTYTYACMLGRNHIPVPEHNLTIKIKQKRYLCVDWLLTALYAIISKVL